MILFFRVVGRPISAPLTADVDEDESSARAVTESIRQGLTRAGLQPSEAHVPREKPALFVVDKPH